MDQQNAKVALVEIASKLTEAWLNNSQVRATSDDATQFLENMHAKLVALTGSGGTASAAPTSAAAAPIAQSDDAAPAVTVRKSLASPDHIISMIDGKPYKSLKRHIGSHGLTPEAYRERFNLKADYPMVAPAYAEKRRQLAKKIGLGKKTGGRKKAPAAAKSAPKKK